MPFEPEFDVFDNLHFYNPWMLNEINVQFVREYVICNNSYVVVVIFLLLFLLINNFESLNYIPKLSRYEKVTVIKSND